MLLRALKMALLRPPWVALLTPQCPPEVCCCISVSLTREQREGVGACARACVSVCESSLLAVRAKAHVASPSLPHPLGPGRRSP